MDKETEKLLSVLDMDDHKKYWEWCEANAGKRTTESLADIAFRLRDEVDRQYTEKTKRLEVFAQGQCLPEHPYYIGLNRVWGELKFDSTYNFVGWIVYEAKPIHIIIACLIAKLENK